MLIVFIVFAASILIQLLYYVFVFARLNWARGIKSMPETLPKVSIIICAKNEAENLARNLKIVLIQQYKEFEVIVVDDQSTDNTLDVLVEFYKRNKVLKIVSIEPSEQKPYAGKKYALMKGVEAASYDTLLLTDADCWPLTTHWLTKMAASYMHESKIVLGHAPYEANPGFLNKIIRYQNFVTAMQYFGFAKAGLPYMGVGRNLSYKKDLLEDFKGFEKDPELLSGDDDLFINAVAKGGNTEICIDKDAFMVSEAETTFSAWLNQKKRHLRSSFKYTLGQQFLLFLFAFSNLVFYVGFIVLLSQFFMIYLLLALFSGWLLIKMLLTFRLYKKLGCGDLLSISPILDVTYTGYLVIIFFLLLLKPKDSWKT